MRKAFGSGLWQSPKKSENARFGLTGTPENPHRPFMGRGFRGGEGSKKRKSIFKYAILY